MRGHAVGQPKASASHVLLAQPRQKLEKAGFKVAWEGINYRTVSFKSDPFDALWYDFDGKDAPGM